MGFALKLKIESLSRKIEISTGGSTTEWQVLVIHSGHLSSILSFIDGRLEELGDRFLKNICLLFVPSSIVLQLRGSLRRGRLHRSLICSWFPYRRRDFLLSARRFSSYRIVSMVILRLCIALLYLGLDLADFRFDWQTAIDIIEIILIWLRQGLHLQFHDVSLFISLSQVFNILIQSVVISEAPLTVYALIVATYVLIKRTISIYDGRDCSFRLMLTKFWVIKGTLMLFIRLSEMIATSIAKQTRFVFFQSTVWSVHLLLLHHSAIEFSKLARAIEVLLFHTRRWYYRWLLLV